MISKDTIDKMFEVAKLEEIVEEFIILKKSGSNLKGLSPFNYEKTPSFVVSPSKQIWKDFSSGKGGNIVTFIMEIENITYPQAIRWICKKYNIEINEDNYIYNKELNEKEILYNILNIAKDYFKKELIENHNNKIAINYLFERGIDKSILEEFDIGFCRKGSNFFTKKLQNYDNKYLNELGLINTYANIQYDNFQNRIIFPIYNYSGRVVGFGARSLDKNPTNKYLNSPENNIYIKNKELYGIFQSKKHIIKNDNCYIVEGYTDVLTLHKKNIKNVVACCGTSITYKQINIIKRLTNNITLMYDCDHAGRKATMRAIDILLENDINIKVVRLPLNKDPNDTFINKTNNETLSFILNNTINIIDYKISELVQNDDPNEKYIASRNIIKSISLINDHIKRELYIKDLSNKLNIEDIYIYNELKNTENNSIINNKKFTINKHNEINYIDIYEYELIKLMIEYGDVIIDLKNYKNTVIEEIIYQIKKNNLKFKNKVYLKIIQYIENGLEHNELRTIKYFYKLNDNDISNILINLINNEHNPNIDKWILKNNKHIKSYEKYIPQLIFHTINRIKINNINDCINNLKSELNKPNCLQQEDIFLKISELNNIKNNIKKKLNFII